MYVQRSIRLAAKEEYTTYLNIPDVRESLLAWSKKEDIPEYIEGRYYLLSYRQYSMIAEVQKIEVPYTSVYEVHIACSKANMKAYRVMLLNLMLRLQKTKGATAVVTACYSTSAANLAKKLGFIHTSTDADGEMHFIYFYNFL